MKTDDLIDELAAGLTPVQPMRRPGTRAAIWLAGSVLYLGALAIVVSNLHPATVSIGRALLLSQSIGVVAGILAVAAAFASVVPGHSKHALIAASAAVIVWLVSFVVAAAAGEIQAITAARNEWICVAIILAGGMPLAVTMAVMLRQGAPLTPRLTGLLIAMAVGLLANFSACLALPHADSAVALAWHGGALLVMALAGIIAGRFAFSWR